MSAVFAAEILTGAEEAQDNNGSTKSNKCQRSSHPLPPPHAESPTRFGCLSICGGSIELSLSFAVRSILPSTRPSERGRRVPDELLRGITIETQEPALQMGSDERFTADLPIRRALRVRKSDKLRQRCVASKRANSLSERHATSREQSAAVEQSDWNRGT